MIILVDNDFKIIQSEFGYDLYRLTEGRRVGEGTISNPSGDVYQKEDIIGYYTDLKNVISKIIHLRLLNNTETVTLREYLRLYREQVDRIEQIIKP